MGLINSKLVIKKELSSAKVYLTGIMNSLLTMNFYKSVITGLNIDVAPSSRSDEEENHENGLSETVKTYQ